MRLHAGGVNRTGVRLLSLSCIGDRRDVLSKKDETQRMHCGCFCESVRK